MAAHMALSCSVVLGKIWPKIIRYSTVCSPKRMLSTSSVVARDEFRTTEQSWVRRILRGSGPSKDIDDTLDEEEIVEVEPQYMDIIQTPKATFIEKPQVRIKSYQPPDDLVKRLHDITLEVVPDATSENWKEVSLKDNSTKYQILVKCFTEFKHDIPNFLLSKMHTVEDVITFYETEVKDKTKFDELSTVDLPPNLKIHWNYGDDSRLELYEDYLEYVKPNRSPKPPEWKYRPS
ncbi:39S ribosomal protein L50, mitochondrial-like [Acanthaster planci]|uniref:Large ribosomal subunit protein mL50 n=1 Tax=Acanthaster planci TaxID=133434 RepID=A0A8B7XYC0_ACAPL|nr:39S ribosomal protein L50, mitochondrial-like [Acanthaster planci]